MNPEKTVITERSESTLLLKLRGCVALFKFRLSFLVVFSALFGYLMGVEQGGISLLGMLWVGIGGFLVTGASNTFNQILETEYDRMMIRTRNRPLPTSSLNVGEALFLAILSGVGGILILGFAFNLVTALLAIIALLSYAFVYTPLKRIHPIAVLVGAIPGALPPLIGWAASGHLSLGAIMVFFVQFIWQFPHFWAIAWILDEDYNRAGFKLLPDTGGKNARSAAIIFIYTALLIPASFAPYLAGSCGWAGLSVLLLMGAWFSFKAWQLLNKKDDASAKALMFGSFLYLPVVQIALVADKFWM